MKALSLSVSLSPPSVGGGAMFLTHPTEFIKERTTETPRYIARSSQSTLAHMDRYVPLDRIEACFPPDPVNDDA